MRVIGECTGDAYGVVSEKKQKAAFSYPMQM